MNQTEVSYNLAKTAFGCYLVEEVQRQLGKPHPTETDTKKLLLSLNSGADVGSAKQISRYCRSDRDYLRDAREDTLNKIAAQLRLPIQSLMEFRKRLSPAFNTTKHYQPYLQAARAYLAQFDTKQDTNARASLAQLFDLQHNTPVFLSLISYHFGAQRQDLPALSFGAESDIRTERIVRKLLDEHDFAEPTLLPEARTAETIAAHPKGVFVAIGLFNNPLVAWLQHKHLLPEGLRFKPAANQLQVMGQVFSPSRSTQTDYALLLKLRIEHQTFWVIGGIEGFGTEQIGLYLQHNWATLLNDLNAAAPFWAVFKTTPSQTTLELTDAIRPLPLC